MGQLRTRMTEDLQLAGYSQTTVEKYLHYSKQFAGYFMRSQARNLVGPTWIQSRSREN